MSAVYDEDFVPEIQENLEGFEAIFLELDPSNYNQEHINKIAFYAHNFKGSSQIAGLENLAKYLHEFENFLSSVKNETLTWSQPVCDFFFSWIDTLKNFAENYSKKKIIELDLNWIKTNHDLLLNNQKNDIQESVPSDAIPAKIQANNSFELKKSVKNVLEKAEDSNNKNNNGPEFIRTSLEKLDELLNYVGELVVNQAVLNNHLEKGTVSSKSSLDTIGYLNKIVHNISLTTLNLRMIPLKQFFQKIKRISRDVATIEKKNVNIELFGEDVELDKTIVEKITDPIIHIVKNAIDHGIETPEKRKAANKNPMARLKVSAIQKESVAEIIIEDDGGGINKEIILNKAIEKGIITSEAVLTDDQIYAFIFHAGFSTKTAVTEISGRGVGMDVVKKVIDELQGRIQIKSELGKGTTFRLTIPLSLSIINGMVVRIGTQKYIVPLSQLQETIELSSCESQFTGNGRVIQLRGEVIPVVSLGALLNRKAHVDSHSYKDEKGLIVIIDGEKLSFEVDEIIEQQQIVVKKFGEEMEGVPGLAGGAILSDGEPGIILNLQEFITEGIKYGRSRAN